MSDKRPYSPLTREMIEEYRQREEYPEWIATLDARDEALRSTLGFWRSILDPMPGATDAVNVAHARAFAEQAVRLLDRALDVKP